MKENTAVEQVGSDARRLESFFTRRGFVKVSSAFVASMVALGLLPETAAALPTSSSGAVDYYAAPTHVLKVDRARCTGCQRCEMSCTLTNDGVSQPAAARIHVRDGFNFGAGLDTSDGIYYSQEWQVRACHMCKTALCQTACPQVAIYSDDNGVRTVDTDKCVGCGTCVTACPWSIPVINNQTGTMQKCIACGRCSEQCPNGAIELVEWEDVNHSSGPTRFETTFPIVSETQDYVGGGVVE